MVYTVRVLGEKEPFLYIYGSFNDARRQANDAAQQLESDVVVGVTSKRPERKEQKRCTDER